MQPMYPDTAQAYFCPFKEMDKHCNADNCLAWLEVPDTDGMGICGRLSRKRNVLFSGMAELEVVPMKIGSYEGEAIF
ncbi:MAG: hypothetical protein LWW87_08555 [Geobacteraceae bacterium]|nr:hypothetical protein [Geobacteraceae bacterium]